MFEYDIRVVAEDALPSEYQWAMVEHRGRMTLLVKPSATGPRVMAEAWAAFRKLDRHHTPCPSRERPPEGSRPDLRVV